MAVHRRQMIPLAALFLLSALTMQGGGAEGQRFRQQPSIATGRGGVNVFRPSMMAFPQRYYWTGKNLNMGKRGGETIPDLWPLFDPIASADDDNASLEEVADALNHQQQQPQQQQKHALTLQQGKQHPAIADWLMLSDGMEMADRSIRSDGWDPYDGSQGFSLLTEAQMGKRSVALGRGGFRPAKRSMAVGRLRFRPGKRSIATGRTGFRPGKRSEGATATNDDFTLLQ